MSGFTISRATAIAALNAPGGKRILRDLIENGPRSRTLIAQSTGLTETAVSRMAHRLIAAGLIEEETRPNSRTGRGRPSIDLRFSEHYYVAGMGIRGYTQWVELRRLDGGIIDAAEVVCDDLTDPEVVLRRCSDALHALLAARKVARRRVLHLGVLIVGVVDPVSGAVLRAENLGWRHVEVKRILRELIDLPSSVEAMLNGMNLLQQIESSPRCEDTLLVSVALGIGASAIVGGRMVRGSGAAAGQLGHTQSMSSRSTCVCGRVGCLDTISSGRALLQSNGMLTGKPSPNSGFSAEKFRELSASAQSRPDLALKLAEAGRELGRSVGTAVALLDPKEIVFTGFVVEDDHYFDAVLDELTWYRTGTSAQRVRCVRLQNTGAGAPTLLAMVMLTSEAEEAR